MKLVTPSLVFALALLMGASAAPGDDLANPWTPLAEGVWHRQLADGATEILAEGRAGVRWAMPMVRGVAAELMADHLRDGSVETWDRVLEAHDMVSGFEARLAEQNGPRSERGIDERSSCNVSAGAAASVGWLYWGIRSDASSHWWNDCNALGYVYARAYAESPKTTESGSCFDSSRSSTSCSVAANAIARTRFGDCTADAQAYVLSTDGLYVYIYRSAAGQTCEGP